jgi:hypothetical protein
LVIITKLGVFKEAKVTVNQAKVDQNRTVGGAKAIN